MRALNDAGNPPPPIRPCVGAIRCPPAPGAPYLFPLTEPAALSEGCLQKSLRSPRLAAAPSSTSSRSRVKVGVSMATPVISSKEHVK